MENPVPRLLLIDDDELSRAVLQLHLEAAGYEVMEAESGEDALTLLRGETGFSVVLSDLQMPGLSGPELAAALRGATGAKARLIVMSGSEPRADRIAGFDAFLLKPFSMEELARALEAPGSSGAPSRSPAPSHKPVLEDAAFLQISSMLTPVQLREIFALCFSELEKYLAAMRAALAAGNAEQLRDAAHTMKGSFGMVGARELESLAASIEAGAGSPANQAATLEEISPAVERLRRMLSSRGVPLARDPASGQETS